MTYLRDVWVIIIKRYRKHNLNFTPVTKNTSYPDYQKYTYIMGGYLDYFQDNPLQLV